MFKRKITKKELLINSKYKNSSRKDLKCNSCNRIIFDLHADVKAVTCEYCVQKLLIPPAMPKSSVIKQSDTDSYPRGWHLKNEYKAPDGKLYKRGRLIDESVKKVVKQTKLSKSAKKITTNGRATNRNSGNKKYR